MYMYMCVCLYTHKYMLMRAGELAAKVLAERRALHCRLWLLIRPLCPGSYNYCMYICVCTYVHVCMYMYVCVRVCIVCHLHLYGCMCVCVLYATLFVQVLIMNSYYETSQQMMERQGVAIDPRPKLNSIN